MERRYIAIIFIAHIPHTLRPHRARFRNDTLGQRSLPLFGPTPPAPSDALTGIRRETVLLKGLYQEGRVFTLIGNAPK